MAILEFQVPRHERDLLISSYLPLVWLALVQAQQIDEGRPDTVAVGWLKDLAEAVAPLLTDADPVVIERARRYTEQAIGLMRKGRTS